MQSRGYLTLSGGASSTWIAPLGGDRGTAGVELRADRFSDADERGAQQTATGGRLGGALLGAIDLQLAPQLVVTPAIRADAVRTSPTPIEVGSMPMPETARWDLVPSPRMTARLAVRDDLALKGSGGWYVRLPTLLELFGDRGYILGAPDLKPERGPSCDVGGVWAPARSRGVLDRILVEADVFATRARDTIAFITTAGFVARAQNIGQTETYGAELVASARVARTLSLTASYTRLDTEQISDDVNLAGKPIPRDPGHALYARADLVRPRFALWLDAGYQSESALDPAGLGSVPARTLVGAGATVPIAAGFAISLSFDNLLDARITDLPLVPPPSPTFTTSPTPLSDVAGFPLPGRSFYLTLQWSHS
jgi:iron complex outermembrane receptor protein